ncbi:MAG: hypothetical protein JNM27_03100 [Leptospirales bacterium]|nr:hypothetical protein [Leptospirales bacterium]
MKRSLALVAGLLTCTVGVHAKPTLLVLKPQGQGVSDHHLAYVYDIIRIRLSRSNAFGLLELTDAHAIPSETELANQIDEMRECSEAKCALYLGQRQGAELVLLTRILQKPQQQLILFLYKVESGQLLYADETPIPMDKDDEAAKRIKSVIDVLIERTSGMTSNSPQTSRDPEEQYSILYRGLLYPGLGHFKIRENRLGLLYSSLFTLTLYNAAIRTPQTNQNRLRDRDSDVRAMLLTNVLMPAGSTFLGENSRAGLIFLGSAYLARDRELQAAKARTRYSLLLLSAAYAWSIVDLAGLRLNLIAMPGSRDSSHGLAFVYRF